MAEHQGQSIGQIVARGVAFSGGGNILLRVLDLGIAVLLLRWLSIYEYGVYRLVLAAFDFGTGFFLSGLENVIISDVSGAVSRELRRAKALFSTYIFLMSAVGILLWAAFFFGFSFFKGWVPEGAQYLRIASFLFLLAPLETIYKWQFQIFLSFGWATLLRVLREVTRLVTILAAFYLFTFGIQEALWTLVIAGFLPIMIAFLGYRGSYLVLIPTLNEMGQALRELFLRHGKWAIADDFLSNTGRNIRPFIIRFFLGTEAVAVFAVAQNLLAYTTSIFPIRDVLTPAMPRNMADPKRLGERIGRVIKYSIYAHVFLGLAAAVGTPFLIYILFPKYISSLPLFYIMLLGLPWIGFRSVVLPVFYAFKAQQTLFILTGMRLASIVLLGVVLISVFGLWGAALEALLLNFIITPAFSRALTKLLPEWKWSFRSLLTIDAYDKLAFAAIWLRIQQKMTRLLLPGA